LSTTLTLPIPVVALVVATACGAGQDLTEPAVGTLQIISSTVGELPDPDGYSVIVDGGQPVGIGVADTVMSGDLAAGDRRIELSGLAPHCTVDGSNPRTVAVVAGIQVQAAFLVRCPAPPATGAIEVAVATSGSDLDPDGYTALVDPGGSQTAELTGVTTFQGLVPGPHAVRLDGIADNCSVKPANPRTVEVSEGGLSRTAFEVVCRPPLQGQRIAYVSDGELFLSNADGTARRNIAEGGNPAWSPDGVKIAFGMSDDAVHLVNPDGTGLTALHTGFSNVSGPVWSPDGAQILFRTSETEEGLGVVNADGSQSDLIATASSIGGYAWSPDGTRVAFDRDTAVFVVNADGSHPVNLTGSQTDVTFRVYGWSPDGRWIALVRDASTFFSNQEIDLLDPATGVLQNVTNDPGIYRAVSWSPDGTELAFAGKRNPLPISGGPEDWDIFSVNVDGTGLANLTTNTPDDYQEIAWSPDGSRFVFQIGPTIDPFEPPPDLITSELGIVNTDGSGRLRLTGNSHLTVEPAWGP
jgi:Tol biopolymer transport system component